MNTKEFHPTLIREKLKKNILSKQENEGNNTLVVNTIETELAHSLEIDFFSKFIDVCKKYKVQYFALKNHFHYEIKIMTNGRETYKISYKDAKKDVTDDFSDILYRQLFTQIVNYKYIDKVKNQI